MNKETQKVVIIDFDGTIADTFETLVKSLSRYTGDLGIEAMDKKILDDLRLFSAGELIQKFRIPKILLPFIVLEFRFNVGRDIKDIAMFENIDRALSAMYDTGFKLGILTTNSVKNVKEFLRRNEIAKYFDFIESDSGLFNKDKVLNKILKKYELNKEDVLYIGDEIRDIESCKKAGIKIISVTWGFNLKEGLIKHNKYICENPCDLLSVIKEAFKA